MVEASNPTASNNDTQQEAPVADSVMQEEEKKEPSQATTSASSQAAATSGLPTISTTGVVPLPKTVRGQFEYGKSLKEEGNLYFKQKDYANAIKKYARVRAFLKPVIPNSDSQGQDNSQFLNMISQQSNNDDERLSKEEVKEAIQV